MICYVSATYFERRGMETCRQSLVGRSMEVHYEKKVQTWALSVSARLREVSELQAHLWTMVSWCETINIGETIHRGSPFIFLPSTEELKKFLVLCLPRPNTHVDQIYI